MSPSLRMNYGAAGDFARHDNLMKFFETLAQTFANKPIDWDELEASLIRPDLDVPMTTRIMQR